MTNCGTYNYVAPEVFYCQGLYKDEKICDPYDFKADVWSVGVLAFSLVNGTLPYSFDTWDVKRIVYKYKPDETYQQFIK